jgi:hypothetical protein
MNFNESSVTAEDCIENQQVVRMLIIFVKIYGHECIFNDIKHT